MKVLNVGSRFSLLDRVSFCWTRLRLLDQSSVCLVWDLRYVGSGSVDYDKVERTRYSPPVFMV